MRNGTVTFTDTAAPIGQADGVGGGAGQITVVNGVATGGVSTTANPISVPANGTVTFTIDWAAPGSAVPVVYVPVTGTQNLAVGAGALPCDGDADVDAEHAGEECGGQVGGELEERGGSGLAGAESELAEALCDLVGAEGPAGLPAGEQPAGGSLVADGGVTSSGGDELEDERSERFGHVDGLTSEVDLHLVAAGVDVVEGEAADRGGPLGVEEYEQAGDAVFGFDGVVVEQTACLFPAGFGVDDAGGAAPSGGGELQAGQFLVVGPQHEVPGFVPVDGAGAGCARGRSGAAVVVRRDRRARRSSG